MSSGWPSGTLLQIPTLPGTLQASQSPAQATLQLALDVMLRLFAPFIPFVTDEVWSWWRDGSVHNRSWPVAAELAAGEGANDLVLTIAAETLGAIRKAKTEAKVSIKAPVESVVATLVAERAAALRLSASDVADAGAVGTLTVHDAADEASTSLAVRQLVRQRAWPRPIRREP